MKTGPNDGGRAQETQNDLAAGGEPSRAFMRPHPRARRAIPLHCEEGVSHSEAQRRISHAPFFLPFPRRRKSMQLIKNVFP